MVRNRRFSRKIHDASWGRFRHMLVYKAERASRQLVKVNPGGTSKGLTYNDPYRDYISANRILDSGLGRSFEPVETRPLLSIPASAVVAGQVSSLKQETPPIKEG
ncbi:MAG: hypothetical protein QMC86_01430 [Methanothermobacter sp.]|nr:hypothetical protein [Methanothermobacter sp.]